MVERTDKDFAIEFGGYLANAAEQFQLAVRDNDGCSIAVSEAWRALDSAIYEFRKRAKIAAHG